MADTLDIGLLAETLFFYGSAHLLLDRGSVIELARKIPADDLFALLDKNSVKVSYVRPNFSVMTSGFPPAHRFAAFTFHGVGPGKQKIDYQEEIHDMLVREFGNSLSTRKLARGIVDRLKLHKFSGIPGKEDAICDLALADVKDTKFVKLAITEILAHLLPEYQLHKHFKFSIFDLGKEFVVETDLDFVKLNAIYHQRVSVSHSSINPAYILAHLVAARADSHFAAYYMAEPVTTPLNSNIIRLKHFEFLQRRQTNAEEIQTFHDLIIPDFPSIRETLNEGRRTFGEFLTLLDQADKFKSFIQKTNPDVGLVHEYHRSATASTWADKLPSKSIRFAVATALGVAADAIFPTGLGTTIGITIGGADSLFGDRLIKGWRPNHFIAGPYRKFVEPPTE